MPAVPPAGTPGTPPSSTGHRAGKERGGARDASRGGRAATRKAGPVPSRPIGRDASTKSPVFPRRRARGEPQAYSAGPGPNPAQAGCQPPAQP